MFTIDISPYLDNVGATTAGRTATGRLNVWNNSFAAENLPPGGSNVMVGGVPYVMPPFGGIDPDNIRCAGQYLELPGPGRAVDWLHLLATGERRVEDEIAVHFADGSVDFEPVRVSDFWAAPAAFGEVPAFETLMHYPAHTQFGVPASVWSQRVPVTRRLPLIGIGLPVNAALHVFAVTLQPPDGTRRPAAVSTAGTAPSTGAATSTAGEAQPAVPSTAGAR
ncbi:hypothetical protein [Micromonospora sp. KC723]|uniref:hypothetical protein n=1 Tax=Micromonospora sp. KC723 TaxID=2530381 RepID=UPI001A9FE9C4|nr:hypothetical protein [Micromonospora sp. KC723]